MVENYPAMHAARWRVRSYFVNVNLKIALGIGAALGVGLALLQWGANAPAVIAVSPILAVGWVMNTFDRGNKLTTSTTTNAVVDQLPSDLAASIGVDLDTYSLARMGRSEGVDGMEYRMHVVLNDIADLVSRGDTAYSTITKYMTYSRNSAANGHYSAQDLGKRVSTSKDPYQGDYDLAVQVISDHDSGIDPTNGATKFVDKSGPFYVDGAKTDYDGLVASWAADGLTPIDNLPGATSNFVVFVKG